MDAWITYTPPSPPFSVFNLEASGGGDLRLLFSDGYTVYDTTPAATTPLTEGTDKLPQPNYVYIDITTKALATSLTSWPATEHIKVAYLLLPSDVTTDATGAYVFQLWNDHRIDHLVHMTERERASGAIWFEGVNPNGTESYLTISAGNVEFTSTEGTIKQMHSHTFPVVDTSAGHEILVKNWSGDAFHNTSNLYDIVADSTGSTITNNRWFTLVFWGVANKTGQAEYIICNLPSGTYTTELAAEQDANGYTDYEIPREFSLDSTTGFTICALTVQKTATTWNYGSTVDLRRHGQLGTGGGSGGGVTDHGALNGLTDVADHPGYLLIDGTRALTGDLNLGTNTLSDGTLSNVLIGVPTPANGNFTALSATGATDLDGTLDVLLDLNAQADIDAGGNIEAVGNLVAGQYANIGNDLLVDTDDLFVDVSLDRVGINTDTPAEPLHVTDEEDAVIFVDAFSAAYNTFVQYGYGGVVKWTNGMLAGDTSYYIGSDFQFQTDGDLLVSKDVSAVDLNASSDATITGTINANNIAPIGSIVNVNGRLDVNAASLTIDPAYGVYLDGGSNTYIQESSADNIRFATNGSSRMEVNNSGASITGDLTISDEIDQNGTGYNSLTGPTAFDAADTLAGGAQFQVLITGNDQYLLALDSLNATGQPMLGFFQAGTRNAYFIYINSGDVFRMANERGPLSFWTGTGGSEVERMNIESDGDVEILYDLTVDGEINGDLETFSFGDSSTLANVQYLSVGGTTMSSTKGFVTRQAGSLIGVTASFDILGTGTFCGVTVQTSGGQSITLVSTSTGRKNLKSTSARGTKTFAAGETISAVCAESGSFTGDDWLVTISVVYDD